MSAIEFSERRQLSLFSDPETHESSLYHGEAMRGFFTINQRNHGETRLRQRSYQNNQLIVVLDQLLRGGGYLGSDCYISQQSFTNKTRLTSNILSLSSAYVDLDPYSPRAPALARQLLSIPDPEKRAAFVLEYCHGRGIEPPSTIIHSGRGLYLKWLFTQAIPRAALPRWNALQEHLTIKFSDLAADESARDASRILRVVGTLNQKADKRLASNERVRVVWTRPGLDGAPATFDFGELCDSVLPFTQAQVHELRKNQAIWDANRAFATNSTRKVLARAHDPASGLSAAVLWWDRLSDIRRLVELRYGSAGIPSDSLQRNQFCWIVANALSYNVLPQNLLKEVCAVFREISPSYTAAEARTSASSVVKRVLSGDGAYRFKTETFKKHFGITEAEEKHLVTLGGGRQRKKPVNEGALGFEKMENLPYEEYLVETHRRRREAAKYAAAIKLQNSEGLRAMARSLREQGMPIRAIAEEMSVAKSTVSDWCKS